MFHCRLIICSQLFLLFFNTPMSLAHPNFKDGHLVGLPPLLDSSLFGSGMKVDNPEERYSIYYPKTPLQISLISTIESEALEYNEVISQIRIKMEHKDYEIFGAATSINPHTFVTCFHNLFDDSSHTIPIEAREGDFERDLLDISRIQVKIPPKVEVSDARYDSHYAVFYPYLDLATRKLLIRPGAGGLTPDEALINLEKPFDIALSHFYSFSAAVTSCAIQSPREDLLVFFGSKKGKVQKTHSVKLDEPLRPLGDRSSQTLAFLNDEGYLKPEGAFRYPEFFSEEFSNKIWTECAIPIDPDSLKRAGSNGDSGSPLCFMDQHEKKLYWIGVFCGPDTLRNTDHYFPATRILQFYSQPTKPIPPPRIVLTTRKAFLEFKRFKNKTKSDELDRLVHYISGD